MLIYNYIPKSWFAVCHYRRFTVNMIPILSPADSRHQRQFEHRYRTAPQPRSRDVISAECDVSRGAGADGAAYTSGGVWQLLRHDSGCQIWRTTLAERLGSEAAKWNWESLRGRAEVSWLSSCLSTGEACRENYSDVSKSAKSLGCEGWNVGCLKDNKKCRLLMRSVIRVCYVCKRMCCIIRWTCSLTLTTDWNPNNRE